MSLLARQLVVLLLVAMIPMKGFAAARMLFCGVAHERGPVVVSAVVSAHQGAQPTQAVPPCHAEVLDDAASTGGPTPHESSCSLCAVCCSASSAIAHRFVPHLLAPLSRAPALSGEAAFAGHISPPLDRPPL